MRTIIAGSRTLVGYACTRAVYEACRAAPWTITVVLSGCARGVDRQGEAWAKENLVPVEQWPADWNTGRGAGLVRNEAMAENADALIAVWDGKSRGTTDMIRRARLHGLAVHVHRAQAPEPVLHPGSEGSGDADG